MLDNHNVFIDDSDMTVLKVMRKYIIQHIFHKNSRSLSRLYIKYNILIEKYQIFKYLISRKFNKILLVYRDQLNQIITINNHHIYTGNNPGSRLRST